MTSEEALWIVVTGLSLLVLLLSLLVLGLLRRATPVLERAERILATGFAGDAGPMSGLAVGNTAPPFIVLDSQDREVASSDVLAAPRTVLLFLSSSCESCQQLSAEMGREEWGDPATRLVVVHDAGEEPPTVSGDADIYRQGSDRAASNAFATNITPQAFLVDSRGKVLAKTIAESLTQLRRFADRSHDASSGHVIGVDEVRLRANNGVAAAQSQADSSVPQRART